MCLGHQLGTSGAVTSACASLGRWASARLDPDATPDSTSSLYCVIYAEPACVSPVPRLASATAPRALRERVTHATPVETRERSRGHGPVHGRVQLFHSLATPATTFSGPGYIDSDKGYLNGYYTVAPTRKSGRDPRIDATATRNIPVPPPRSASGTRMRHAKSMSADRTESTRRVVWLASVQRGARPAGHVRARHERGGERRRGRRAGAAPPARARLVLTAFLTAGLSRRQTSLKVQACAVL